MQNFDEFFSAYAECSLWSSDIDDAELSSEALETMRNDCQMFLSQAKGIIPLNAYSQAGHDFWLTRNGHGAGFWETPDWPEEIGAPLTRLSHQFKECTLYTGDDRFTYLM